MQKIQTAYVVGWERIGNVRASAEARASLRGGGAFPPRWDAFSSAERKAFHFVQCEKWMVLGIFALVLASMLAQSRRLHQCKREVAAAAELAINRGFSLSQHESLTTLGDGGA